MKKTEFEDLFIFTFQDIYYHVTLLVDTYYDIRELLIETYLETYVQLDKLPQKDEQLDWIRKFADKLAETKFNVSETNIEAAYEKQSQDHDEEINIQIDETSIFLDIEERLGSLTEPEEPETKKTYMAMGLQGAFSCALLFGAVFALGFGITKVREQLEFINKPIIKPMLDADGKLPGTEKEEKRIQIGNKVVYLSDIGQVLYSLPLEETDLADQPAQNPEIQKQEGWTYYLPCPERSDSSLADVAPFLNHTLYRIGVDGKEIEIIASEVDNYTFWEDGIYISQFGKIQRIGMDEEFEKQTLGIYPKVENNEIYLYDMLGKALKTNSEGTIHYGDRVLKMHDNCIEDVESITHKYKNVTYYFKETENGLSKEIYRKVNGREELFTDVGESIDSFCIVGDYLYFSAYIRTGGSGTHYSELYRKVLNEDKEAERIHEEFGGRMYQMYYSEDANQIYANYTPKNWKSNHGVIAVISKHGQIGYLDDKELREAEETTGNDTLEFIMVYDNQVYCFWKDCSWKPGDTPIPIWRKILVIPNSKRVQMND